jgi:hypothetical protein
MSDNDVLASKPHSTVEEALDDRIEGLTGWLKKNGPECVEEQVHLDNGTSERLYWHYGYLVALRDVRDFLQGRRRSLN